MKTVETTFKLSFTPEQYEDAVKYVQDMKKHRKRVFWLGKENWSDEELIYAHLAHKILSGFYNNYNYKYANTGIIDMKNRPLAT